MLAANKSGQCVRAGMELWSMVWHAWGWDGVGDGVTVMAVSRLVQRESRCKA